jgi:hypothetical protein
MVSSKSSSSGRLELHLGSSTVASVGLTGLMKGGMGAGSRLAGFSVEPERVLNLLD